MLKKIDNYIISEFWLPFISGAGIITGVWLGIDKFKEVFKLLAKSGASFSTGLVILGLEIPHILSITIPISVLLAAFLTFQRLSSQSEVIAMRAAGSSFTRMMQPVVIVGCIAMSASFILSEFVVPYTTPFAKKVYMLALYNDPIAKKSVKGFSYFEKDQDGTVKRIFYVKKLKEDVLKNIVILDFSKKQTTMVHTANEGLWDPQKGGWMLFDGTSSFIKTEKIKGKNIDLEDEDALSESMHLVSNFEETLIPSGINPNELLKKISKVRDMNFVSLKKLIDKHEDNGIHTDDLNDMKTKLYNKFSYPVSCLFVALIGACLGISSRRRQVTWGYIALGMVVFVFYMSQTMFDSFGSSGRIEPIIAVWMPNLILSLVALSCFLYRAER